MSNLKKFLKIFLPVLILVTIAGVAYLFFAPEPCHDVFHNPSCSWNFPFEVEVGFFVVFLGIPISIFVTWVILLMRSRSEHSIVQSSENLPKHKNLLIVILPIILLILVALIFAFSSYNYHQSYKSIPSVLIEE